MKDIVDEYGMNDFQTHLQIFNYDYTIYTLVASLNTCHQGSLGINISYRGSEYATMYVLQMINNMTYSYKYQFDPQIFEKTLRKMLSFNIKQLAHKCIYRGNVDTIKLINRIIQDGKLERQ
jgi:hypothetical protein